MKYHTFSDFNLLISNLDPDLDKHHSSLPLVLIQLVALVRLKVRSSSNYHCHDSLRLTLPTHKLTKGLQYITLFVASLMKFGWQHSRKMYNTKLYKVLDMNHNNLFCL